MVPCSPEEVSSQSQQTSSWEIDSSSSEIPEVIEKLLDPEFKAKVPERRPVQVEVVIPKLNRVYIAKEFEVFHSDSENALSIKATSESEASVASPTRPNSHKLKPPQIFSPKKTNRRTNIIESSESEVSENEDTLEALEKEKDELDSDVILETRTRPKRSKLTGFKLAVMKRKKRVAFTESESEEESESSLQESEDGFRQYSDSIVDEADFVVDVSTDEEQRGFELLPELFSRDIGFRGSFDIFIEVLVRVSLDEKYLEELDKESKIFRGYKDVLAKIRGYSRDLAEKYKWRERFREALFNCPIYAHEEIFSVNQDEGHADGTQLSIELEGDLYDMDTLNPTHRRSRKIGGRFAIPRNEASAAHLCHKLQHFHFKALEDIKQACKKVALKTQDLEKSSQALLVHLSRNNFIKQVPAATNTTNASQCFSRLEVLLNDAAHITSGC
ncbi:Coiled-coil domain-containing protein 82 [Entomophthora muscae]|uniref:Coiled-coil domain-containing protein 82 n=1 Tax=Entomophthora muscae TaxID=34485 RepID=A0ACC2SL10_9FUNG|nr:Coiled-coil domain-containing protein 82 [Entomophthora muscae]